MKKILTLGLSCACLLASALALNTQAKKLNEAAEDTMTENNPSIELRKAVIGQEGEVSYSPTYVQYGKDAEGKYCLRFATAVKGNISKLTYTRTLAGLENNVVDVSTVYVGISAGDKTYYYNGTDLTTDETSKGDYYWACYTIQFATDTYKASDITASLVIEDVEGNKATPTSKTASLQGLIDSEQVVQSHSVKLGKAVGGAWEKVEITWTDDSYDLATGINLNNIAVKVVTEGGAVLEGNGFLDYQQVDNDANKINFGVGFPSADFRNGTCTWTIELTSLNVDKAFIISFTAKEIREINEKGENVGTGFYEMGEVTVTERTLTKYTVSFDSNGGSACESKEVTVGKTYGELPKPTRDGYSFEGWYNGNELVNANTVVNLTGNVTLTAKWGELRIYDATLGGGAGAWEKVIITWNDDTYDLKEDTPLNGIVLTKKDGGTIGLTGFTFGPNLDNGANKLEVGAALASAEFRNSTCEWKIVLNGADGTARAIVFTATESNGTYTISNYQVKTLVKHMVSFDSNGGSACDAKEVIVGETYGELPKPTKDGFSFDGWYNGDELVTDKTIVNLTGDVTFTAKWGELRAYDVALGGGGGAWEKVIITWTDDAYDLAEGITKENIDVVITKQDGNQITLMSFIDTCNLKNDINRIQFGASLSDPTFRGTTCDWKITLTGKDGVVRTITFAATEANGSYTISNYQSK